MDTSTNLTNPSGKPQTQIVRSDPLPRWEQLPLERQRELVMLLATLLLKRLPSQELTREEVSDG
jgi:hypothetical protein